MSVSDNDFNLDLHFLPAWAQKSPDLKKFAHHTGVEDRQRDREQGFKPRPRSPDKNFRSAPPARRRDGDPRPAYAAGRRPDERARFIETPPAPLPEIDIILLPDEKGVESISRQIKLSGRAYPLFDIAHMILQKPERQQVKLSVVRKPDGEAAQKLFLCALDDTVWLSEEEAVTHVLSRHFETFYATEKTATEPPKGTYTFVAQCGMSGMVLGPPNYHDYQNQLRKLHAERFSRIPFEVYKSRVKIVKDEATVKKWIEDQSWKYEFVCLNVPEPKKLATREEVEKHFHETHKAIMIKPVDSHLLTGAHSREQKSPVIQRLIRREWEEQRRFPLKVVNILSQQFAQRGLHFFKVNKTVTHVSVARPHYLDLEMTPVSERIKKIVDFINAHPKCRHRNLIDALAPAAAIPVEHPAPPTGSAPPPAESPELTPEQTALVADLHWLVHEGHVIEFASGLLETAKKPIFRPPKPARVVTETSVAKPDPSAPQESDPASHGQPNTSEAAPADSPEQAPQQESQEIEASAQSVEESEPNSVTPPASTAAT